ncbi:LysR substrate-binding domain-containing protein [Congregibacter sp.]|uniref:LysR substrate-binding domain-containing protein n=1 Tax=Congregibacter sp. TaxID=2744308 RepID=UPI003F6AFF97
MPSLNSLRAFEAAARHLSLKRAAEELCVSQSAISHQIKALESQLGASLFLRKARGVELTSKGELYYPALRSAFNAIADATNLVMERQSRDVITLQVYATFAIRWLLPRLAKFQEAFPALQVRLHTNQSDADLAHNDIDAAIVIGNPPPSLSAQFLFTSHMRPACSPEFLQNEGPLETPADIVGKPLLQVYPSSDDWLNWFKGVGLGPEGLVGSLQLESYEVAINSAESGMGIMLGQEPYIDKRLKAGTLVEPIAGAKVKNPNSWHLVARPERWETPKLAALRSWLLVEIAADTSLAPD